MIDILKRDWRAQVAIFIFIALTVWWFIAPSFKKAPDARFLGDPASIYFVIAFWGAFWGLVIARRWGGLRSVMGQSILFLSLGLMGQVFGQVAYAYYPFVLHQPTPYPTVGDFGYFGSILLYIFGVYLLAKAAGVKVGLKSFANKIQAVIIPLVVLIIGYILFLQGYKFDWSTPLKIFIDLGAPFAQAISFAFAFLTYTLTNRVLGGVMKSKVLYILFALIAQFIADWTFLYQSSRGLYQVGGINDYMYFLAYVLMTLALLQLNVQAIRKHLD